MLRHRLASRMSWAQVGVIMAELRVDLYIKTLGNHVRWSEYYVEEEDYQLTAL